MRPTNVLADDEFLLQQRFDHGDKDNEEIKKGNNSRIFKTEKKNATLSAILKHEHIHFSNSQPADVEPKTDNEEDQHYSYYDHMDENLNYKIEEEHQIQTKYAWAHLS